MAAPGITADALDATTVQRLLTTATFGRSLHILSQTGSTNDDAKILAQRGAAEGTVVLAEQQTAGRGRQGRTFASPAGVGIYLSLLLRPQVPAGQLPQLTLVVAVATAEAITETCALAVGLKWPNDIEVNGKKVAGILTEAVWSPDGTLAVIIGIGINVNTTLAHLPPALHQRVTSLALETGALVARLPLIARLLAHLERDYETFLHTGFPPILERWRRYSCIVGRHVRWGETADAKEGTVLGVDDAGALLVRTAHGTVHRVIAGEVVFL
jgi:BirA family biotin operon repressor/biotin-[acetyl-CoA-carboxylase] ligase